MEKYTKLIFGGIIIAFIVGVFIYTKLDRQNKHGGKQAVLKNLTVGFQVSPAMALVMVAKDKGFYEQEGLNVELKEFTAGKFALQAFFGGSLDIAISGDVPVALATLQGNKTLVAGQVVAKTTNEVRIVANTKGVPFIDTGKGKLDPIDYVNRPRQYFESKKRKLATSFGGGPEFFTYEFLNDIGIEKDQIELISQTPADMPAALLSGSVDAISIFDPFAFIAERQLRDRARRAEHTPEFEVFINPNIYSELYVVNTQPSVKGSEDKQETIRRFLHALVEAEQFIEGNYQEAQKIVMNYTKLDQETIESIWSNFDFRVVLTPKLMEYWKREVEWAKATDKVKKDTPMPNFQEIIFDTPLKNISPERVEW